MPTGLSRPAVIRVGAALIASLMTAAGCTPLSTPPLTAGPGSISEPMGGPRSLVADLAPIMPGSDVVTVPPGVDSCGQAGARVIRGAFPDAVLFATGSDEPAPNSAEVLALMADRLRRDAPEAAITVLGHTDAVGSDAYNIDLSRRRALHVLRALVDQGLDPGRLSAVAIGKRQPIADNGSAAGRARNRRVEFLISGCLAANLGVVRARASAADDGNTSVDVVRLDPSSGYGLATVGTVSLRGLSGDRVEPATVAPAPSEPLRVLRPPVGVARPAPAPHYQPKALSPEAQPNPLGPAVPF